ncbi:MAG: DUF4097 family beta strand repeat-containing protein [Candidatus Korobacteraceae bacterium]
MSGDIANQLKTRGAIFAALVAMILAPSAYASGNNVTEEFHKTVALNSDGRVALENINGNVEVTGWDKNEVQIDAVKSARDQQRLDEAKIEVEGSGDKVRIRTRYAEGHTNDNPASVHYTVHVPTGANLDKISLVNGSLEVSQVRGEFDASLVNGKLKAQDLAGRAEISTVNGSSEVQYSTLANVSEVKMSAVNGSIKLILPASANADVSASSVSGSIKSDFPITVESGFVGHHLKGKLGSGGTRIELSNVNGSTHISPGA